MSERSTRAAGVPQAEPAQVAFWRWRSQSLVPAKPATASVASNCTPAKADEMAVGPVPVAGQSNAVVGAVLSTTRAWLVFVDSRHEVRAMR